MITLSFLGFLLLAIAIALVDWRRGWAMALAVGVLQDPARKLTPGTPVVLTYSIVIVYMAIIVAAQIPLQSGMRDFKRRFSPLYIAFVLVLFFLALGAANGLFTYGIENWKVPALSLFIYLAPLPAVIIGYTWMRREEDLFGLLRFYAIITSIAMIGTPLEFYHFTWRSLGMVGLPEGFIRHLPGLQIRILSGFYRAPDIMAWHAAMLTCVGIAMALKRGALQRAWPWFLVSGWGFLNCILSGRRKAVYMVAVFSLVLVVSYIRRLSLTQLVSFALVAITLAVVVNKLSADESASVYTKGTVTTREEIFERLEGGLGSTIDQFGLLGAGLGTATQGVRHLLGTDENIGWQEGGLGKLAIEIGIPGLLAAAFFAFRALRMMWRIAAYPDEPASTQLLRSALLAIAVANIVEFMVSAQAYSDAVLTLFTAFLAGCLFATAALEDRQREEQQPVAALDPVLA